MFECLDVDWQSLLAHSPRDNCLSWWTPWNVVLGLQDRLTPDMAMFVGMQSRLMTHYTWLTCYMSVSQSGVVTAHG